jgi:hypothetical protein
MRRATGTTLVIAIIGALMLLALAACGGGDDESSSDTTAAETVSAPATTEAEVPEESDGSSGTPNFADEDCLELGKVGAAVSSALSGSGADTEDTVNFFNEFADRAPEEIRDDFQIIADAYAKIAEALGDVNLAAGETPSPEALQKLQEVSSQINQAEVTEASNNISAWVQENCGTS